jgi:anti-sigma factor RsiW
MKRNDGKSLDAEQLVIARLIDLRLKSNPAHLETDASLSHPDADSMTSFLEGRLESDDSRALVSHLVQCSSCRHLSAQLARADDEVSDRVGPEKESPFMDGLLDRLRSSFALSTEDAVFAYEEKDQPTRGDAESEIESQKQD